MNPIFWILTSLIALLIFVVLALGLLAISVWLLRWIGRLWCEAAAPGGGDESQRDARSRRTNA